MRHRGRSSMVIDVISYFCCMGSFAVMGISDQRSVHSWQASHSIQARPGNSAIQAGSAVSKNCDLEFNTGMDPTPIPPLPPILFIE